MPSGSSQTVRDSLLQVAKQTGVKPMKLNNPHKLTAYEAYIIGKHSDFKDVTWAELAAYPINLTINDKRNIILVDRLIKE